MIARPTLAALLLFACAIWLARLLVPADHTLSAFLTPPNGCGDAGAPCWFGIRPGETRVEHAVALLRAHPWIEGVTVERRPLVHYIYWSWNGSQPAFVDDPQAHAPPFMWADENIIQFIAIPTLIPYGDIWRLFGSPNAGVFSNHRPTDTHYAAAYLEGRFVVDASVTCPINPAGIWTSPVAITFYSTSSLRGERFVPYESPAWIYETLCGE